MQRADAMVPADLDLVIALLILPLLVPLGYSQKNPSLILVPFLALENLELAMEPLETIKLAITSS